MGQHTTEERTVRPRVRALVMATALALAGCGTDADAPSDEAVDEPAPSTPDAEVEPGPAEPPPTVAAATESEEPEAPPCDTERSALDSALTEVRVAPFWETLGLTPMNAATLALHGHTEIERGTIRSVDRVDDAPALSGVDDEPAGALAGPTWQGFVATVDTDAGTEVNVPIPLAVGAIPAALQTQVDGTSLEGLVGSCVIVVFGGEGTSPLEFGAPLIAATKDPLEDSFVPFDERFDALVEVGVDEATLQSSLRASLAAGG